MVLHVMLCFQKARNRLVHAHLVARKTTLSNTLYKRNPYEPNIYEISSGKLIIMNKN